jgi:hypothetical protein
VRGIQAEDHEIPKTFYPTLPSLIKGEAESTLKNLKGQAENLSLYQPTISAGFLKSGPNEQETNGKAHRVNLAFQGEKIIIFPARNQP